MYYVDFILNYPNRCIIGVKNLMTIVWKIRIYYYLRCNILMLRPICDHWFLMLDKCGVYVRVSREVSITAGITLRPYNTPCCKVFLCLYLPYLHKNNDVIPLKMPIIRILHLLQTLQYHICQIHQLHWLLGVVLGLSFACKYSSKTVEVCFWQ